MLPHWHSSVLDNLGQGFSNFITLVRHLEKGAEMHREVHAAVRQPALYCCPPTPALMHAMFFHKCLCSFGPSMHSYNQPPYLN